MYHLYILRGDNGGKQPIQYNKFFIITDFIISRLNSIVLLIEILWCFDLRCNNNIHTANKL